LVHGLAAATSSHRFKLSKSAIDRHRRNQLSPAAAAAILMAAKNDANHYILDRQLAQ
jgi:hypothetical protein